jgi:hypothetical protein
MVLGFTVPVTTIVASTISACGEVNVVKFVSNLWQVVSFSPGLFSFSLVLPRRQRLLIII